MTVSIFFSKKKCTERVLPSLHFHTIKNNAVSLFFKGKCVAKASVLLMTKYSTLCGVITAVFLNITKTQGIQRVAGSEGEQCCEHSPPTNVAQVRFLDSASYSNSIQNLRATGLSVVN